MKILQTSHFFPVPGGVAVHVAGLSQSLAHRHKVRIMTSSIQSKYLKLPKNLHIDIYPPIATFYRNPISPMLIFSPKLVKWADIVHSHILESLFTLSILPSKKIYRKPWVITLHGIRHYEFEGPLFQRISRAYERIEALLINQVDAIITLNKELKGKIISMYNPECPVIVIPNATNVEYIKNYPKLYHNGKFSRNGKLRITFIGRLTSGKNPLTILNALYKSKNKREKWLITMVGNGPLKDEVISKLNQIRNLGYSTEYYQRLNRKGIICLLKNTDLLVLPSASEGMPLVILEAWAAGVAVLATNVPGIHNLVEHMKTGYLVNLNEEEILVGLHHLLSDDELRLKLAENGQNKVEKDYSWKMVVNQIEKVYQKLM